MIEYGDGCYSDGLRLCPRCRDADTTSEVCHRCMAELTADGDGNWRRAWEAEQAEASRREHGSTSF